MGSVIQDVRYSFRQLRGAPVFTVVAVLSLGLGIGATTTVLCWMQNVLWNPVPGAADQSSLAVLVSSQGSGNVSILDLREFAAYTGRSATRPPRRLRRPRSPSTGRPSGSTARSRPRTSSTSSAFGPSSAGRSFPTRTSTPAATRWWSSVRRIGDGDLAADPMSSAGPSTSTATPSRLSASSGASSSAR